MKEVVSVQPGAASSEQFEEVLIGRSPLADVCHCICLPMAVCCSWFQVDPREELVILNYGKLTEIVDEPGCHYHNCFGREIRRIATSEQSINIPKLRVTDAAGSPVEVSAILTFRFTDPKKALLNVANPVTYVTQQAAIVLKRVCGTFPYESHDGSPSLRSACTEVGDQLLRALQPNVDRAGATISKFMLDELNYAPEIAATMLRTQQARALVQAREVIVQGAVAITRRTIDELVAAGMNLSDADKVRIATNLLTVTCSEGGDARPVLPL